VVICAHPTTTTPEYAPGASLPLGVPIAFESDAFRGKMFLRLKPLPSDGDTGHEAYFRDRKRHYQLILQGCFTEAFSLSDLRIGDMYDKPLKGVPKGVLMKMYEKFMQAISPGLVMDMTSDTPSLFNLLGGSCQTMRVDPLGAEPDISVGIVEEDTTLLFGEEKFASASKRKKYLCKPKNSAKHQVDVNHVYTFEMYDHTMCFASYDHYVMGKKIDMVDSMNGQPLCLAVFHGDKAIVKICIWHERLLADIAKEEAGQK